MSLIVESIDHPTLQGRYNFPMSGSPISHDLDGRDIQPSIESAERPKSVTERGRILLSMVGVDEIIYNAMVLLPASYLVSTSNDTVNQRTHIPEQEAMAVAVDMFNANIASSRMDVNELRLKLQMKFQGETVWATLLPEQWPIVVHDGDAIRVEGKGTKALLGDRRPTVIFNLLANHDRVAALLPQGYEVSHVQRVGGLPESGLI